MTQKGISDEHSTDFIFLLHAKHSGRRDWNGASARDKLHRPTADLGLYTDYLTLQQGEVSGTQLFQFLKAKHSKEVEVREGSKSTTLKGSATQDRRFYIRKNRMGHPISDELWEHLVKQHLGGSVEEWKAAALAYIRETQE